MLVMGLYGVMGAACCWLSLAVRHWLFAASSCLLSREPISFLSRAPIYAPISDHLAHQLHHQTHRTQQQLHRPHLAFRINHDRRPDTATAVASVHNHYTATVALPKCRHGLNLAASQHNLIHDMISATTPTIAQMTAVGAVNAQSKAIRSNLRHFSSIRAPADGGEEVSPPHRLY
jgi:hypothetical protein